MTLEKYADDIADFLNPATHEEWEQVRGIVLSGLYQAQSVLTNER